jgi:hypothetical protein
MDRAPETPAMYCRWCGYALAGLSDNRCPECGRRFDPARRRTFSRWPRGWRIRRWLRRLAIVAAVMLTLATAAGTFFYTQIRRPNRLMMDMNWHATATPSEKLAVAHKILRWGGNIHDAFLTVIEHGGPASVPYVLAAMRGRFPQGVSVCTDLHGLDALRRITNQDFGGNEAAWIAWWQQNKAKPREEWIRDGFAKAGLPVSNPPDDRFVKALIDLLPDKKRADNAWHLLKPLPTEQLLRCIDAQAADPSPLVRQAAVEALGRWKTDACRPRLRTLCKDVDPGVCELALTRLDEIVGEVDAQPVESITIWKMRVGRMIYALQPGPDIDHVLISASAFKPQSTQSDWSTVDLASRKATAADQLAPKFACLSVTRNGRIYETSRDGNVECRDERTGRNLWTLALGEGDSRERDNWQVSSPVFLGEKIILTGWSFIVCIDPADGQIAWKRPIEQGPHPVERAGEYVYVGNTGKIRKVSADGRTVTQRDYPANVRSFLAHPDRLYVVGDSELGAPGVLTTVTTITACSPDTLETLWDYPLPTDDYLGRGLQRVDEVLVIPTQKGITALDASSGSRLWSTVEPRVSFLGGLPDGSLAVSDNRRQLLEIRDRHSGEVVRSYAGIRLPSMCPPLHLPKHGLVCADFDGQLWLLRWPLLSPARSLPALRDPPVP